LATRRKPESGEEQSVTLAAQTLDETSPCVVALVLEAPDQSRAAGAIVLAERGELVGQMFEEHVEVAYGACDLAEPAETVGQRAPPGRIEERPGSAEERTRAPRRDSVLMEILRVLAEPSSGLVCEQRVSLDFDHLAQPQRARIGRKRRRGNERLAADDSLEQARDVVRRYEPCVPGLPLLETVAARQPQAPHDASLHGQA
jgi:hypothetical protein